MKQRFYVDIETRSRVDLKKSNAYRYVQDPDWRILIGAYAVDDEPVRAAIGHFEIYDKILHPYILNPGKYELIAHNAAFERINFSELARGVMELETGEFLPPAAWTCTQALAAEHGLPQKLEHLAVALGGERKDSAGTRLINLFCKPNRQGGWNDATTHPKEWAQFVEYAIQDVVTHRDVHKRMNGWPTATEKRMYESDQMINDAGIPVDTAMAAVAVQAADDNGMVQELEIMELTGIANPNSGPQMLAWLRSQGVAVANMQAATVKTLLEDPDLDPVVRRVLELRQELALVAAKKYIAALDRVNEDGRLRGSFHFFGAHTGRWAGRGVQLQNLPSATLGEKDASPEEVDATIAAAVLDLKLSGSTDAHTLKALVRAMFTGPFTVVDYSAIEARVVAWLAGEEWALQAFRDDRDIYVETAKRMGPQYTRKDGKVATLALGYNGGVNSLRVMGADGNDATLQEIVNTWRGTNQNITNFWYELGEAFRYGDRQVGEHVYVEKDGANRLVRLPSGRAIVYRDLKGKWVVNKWNQRKFQISFMAPKTPPMRTPTYGGKLTENVTQAVARDVLAEAIIRLHDAGKEVVGHVHDEILVLGEHSVDDISKIMTMSPDWADGLPIAAAGFTCPRYRKD